MTETVILDAPSSEIELEIEPMSVLTASQLVSGKNEAESIQAMINYYLEENGANYKITNVPDMNAGKFMDKYGELIETIQKVNGFNQ